MKKTNVWKLLVGKVFGDTKEVLTIERCFEQYRAMVEGWRLNVEGFVDYAKKVPEAEVIRELKLVMDSLWDSFFHF